MKNWGGVEKLNQEFNGVRNMVHCKIVIEGTVGNTQLGSELYLCQVGGTVSLTDYENRAVISFQSIFIPFINAANYAAPGVLVRHGDVNSIIIKWLSKFEYPETSDGIYTFDGYYF